MEQVQQTMGTIAVTGCSIHYQLLFCLASETTTNPAYTASIVGADGKSYVAWMYYTSYCTDNKPKSDCHTPVVFHGYSSWCIELFGMYDLHFRTRACQPLNQMVGIEPLIVDPGILHMPALGDIR